MKMKKNYKDVTIILTLYKTPLNKLSNLYNYRNYKIIVFDQEGEDKTKIFLKKIEFKCKIFFINSKYRLK